MEVLTFFDSIYKISQEAKQDLMQIVQVKEFQKNELIQDLGTRCKTIYLLTEGVARIFYFKEGNDITEHFAFKNDIIVRAESLFTGKPTAKGIQAIASTQALAIDSQKLFQLYDTHHDLERLFRIIFEREYVNTVKRLESLQFMSAKERYLELCSNTDFVLKIPLKYIASYLGITQVSLSRIRANLS